MSKDEVLAPEGMSIDEQLEVLNEVKRTIKGNPTCKRDSCWGRGYWGIRTVHDQDGNPQLLLQLCSCVKGGESDYARFMKALEDAERYIVAEVKDQTYKAMRGVFQIIAGERKYTFFGGIQYALVNTWKFIKKPFRKKSPAGSREK